MEIEMGVDMYMDMDMHVYRHDHQHEDENGLSAFLSFRTVRMSVLERRIEKTSGLLKIGMKEKTIGCLAPFVKAYRADPAHSSAYSNKKMEIETFSMLNFQRGAKEQFVRPMSTFCI
jgi:hypothetical protein